MIRQQNLKEFFVSDQSSHSDLNSEEDLYEPADDEPSKKKRGAPRVPIKWTRVFKVSRNIAQDIKIFNLEKDESKFFEHYNNQNWPENEEWEPLFYPKDFEDIQDQFKCEDYELPQNQLIEYAKKTTNIRKQLQEQADKIYLLEGEHSKKTEKRLNDPPSTYRRAYSGPKNIYNNESKEDDLNFKYQANNPKRKTGKQLSNFEQLNIVHEALVGLKSNSEIADTHQVKQTFVKQLLVNMKKDHLYLQKKFQKVEESEMINSLIVETSQQILNSGGDIWRADQVQELLLQNHGINVTLSKITYAFKNLLSMKFKKIKRIAFLGNAQRCLVMRHMYARQMLDILLQGKTVWNFDESFLNDSFFIRSKWCQAGQQNSIPVKQISPRISVLLAMNNEGDAYLSLSQSETDSEKVILFFEHFFKQLDLAQADWRETSIFLLDGAPYHGSEETMEYFRRKKVAVFISAPYSYDAAAAEMWFSYFKSQDLNKLGLSTGKKYKIYLNLTYVDLFKIQWTWSVKDLLP